MNPDGTDMRQLLSIPTPYGGYFYFLATSNGLYYSCEIGQDYDSCAVFHTDLQGKNKEQLNKQNLGRVDTLIYDQNNLYFTTLNIEGGMCSTVNRLDENGQKSVVIQRIDYFPQDDGINYFYGISDNIFYYFNYDKTNSNSYGMDLHSYDITSKQDKMIAKVEIDYPSLLKSIRGKTFNNQSVEGLYILGNDLYYRFVDTV